MLDDSPQQAWRGAQELPFNLSLTQYLRGQEIIHAEHEVDAHWQGLIRLRFRGAHSPQLVIRPVAPEPGVPNPAKLAWALSFAAGRTPRLWTPKRSFLGDGPLAVQDLQRVVGRLCTGMRTGAQAGPLAVALLDFEDGFGALFVPHPLPFPLQLAVGCTVMMRVYFLTPIRRDSREPSTPGDDLLE